MFQRSVTKKTLATTVIGLVGLIAFVGLLASAVTGHDSVSVLAQNAGLALAILGMLLLVMLSLGRGS